ncbi:MAG: LytR family transcriptional regulator [Spirulina sp. DLM2.Bin59]|nr:MAG: LytR family transcriptional regulator [Spirulina sp. DLM2.Bin59]
MRSKSTTSVISPENERTASAPNQSDAAPVTKPGARVSAGKRLLWGGAFVITASLSATVGATVAMVSPLPTALQAWNVSGELAAEGNGFDAPEPKNTAIPAIFEYKIERPVNILVMGLDQVPDADDGSEEAFAGNTDTMILMRFDPTDNSVRMLSIPRDTQVTIRNVGTTKINAANAHGGAALSMDVVGKTLNGVTIDRYVRVTNDAFRRLVDLVGGVEVFVPKPMRYTDRTQGLEIDLQKGWQVLDGDKAEQFSRFRMDEYGDIGRVQRQQVLLQALRERLQAPSLLPRLPKVVQTMINYVDTDMSLEEILALVNFGMQLDREEVKMVLLPGRFSEEFEFEGISYWIMSHQGRDRVMQDFFDVSPGYAMGDRSLQGVRIALQNATNNPAIVEDAARYLQEQGFRNVFYSRNRASRLLRRSEIIVQQGNTAAATAIQDAMGFGVIQADSTGDLASEITIRVGSDWFDVLSKLSKQQEQETTGG